MNRRRGGSFGRGFLTALRVVTVDLDQNVLDSAFLVTVTVFRYYKRIKLIVPGDSGSSPKRLCSLSSAIPVMTL